MPSDLCVPGPRIDRALLQGTESFSASIVWHHGLLAPGQWNLTPLAADTTLFVFCAVAFSPHMSFGFCLFTFQKSPVSDSIDFHASIQSALHLLLLGKGFLG